MIHRTDSNQTKKDAFTEDSQGESARIQVRTILSAARQSHDSELTLDDIFDENKSAKENKSLMMSYELDRMQMGKYQWFVFGLCGLGYFIDLMWAQALGLIAVPLKNEPSFGADDTTVGTLSTAFNVGLTVGAFTWGILVDLLGRRWSFYLTCLVSSVFGIASGGSPGFTALRVLTAFTGFGVGGNIPIDATITMETLPTNRRFLLALLSLFQPLGVLVASGLAYAFIPRYSCGNGAAEVSAQLCEKSSNMGWRYYLYTLGSITIAIFLLRFFVFNFRESPSFLINKGRDSKALDVVSSIAKLNGRPPPQFTLEDFQEIDRRCDESLDRNDVGMERIQRKSYAGSLSAMVSQSVSQFQRMKILFRNITMARLTILLWITYIADFWGFNIAGFYLPQILRDRGVAANVPLSETYRDYVIIYAPGIVACLLGGLLIEIPTLGRQWTMVISSALMAISMFLYATASSQAASVGLNTLEYFMQSLFNSILYAYTPEVYPSAVRGTAAGFTSTLGRIAGIVAPLAGGVLYGQAGASPDSKVQASKNVLYLGGGVTLLCPVALALLPFDTRGVRSY